MPLHASALTPLTCPPVFGFFGFFFWCVAIVMLVWQLEGFQVSSFRYSTCQASSSISSSRGACILTASSVPLASVHLFSQTIIAVLSSGSHYVLVLHRCVEELPWFAGYPNRQTYASTCSISSIFALAYQVEESVFAFLCMFCKSPSSPVCHVIS